MMRKMSVLCFVAALFLLVASGGVANATLTLTLGNVGNTVTVQPIGGEVVYFEELGTGTVLIPLFISNDGDDSAFPQFTSGSIGIIEPKSSEALFAKIDISLLLGNIEVHPGETIQGSLMNVWGAFFNANTGGFSPASFGDSIGISTVSLAGNFDFTPPSLGGQPLYMAVVNNNDPAPVPEPATLLLMGTGIVGLMGARARKKKSPNPTI